MVRVVKTHPVLLVGDNTGSLQNSLDLKGEGTLLAVSRELAWRKARHMWEYDIAHIPTEHNSAPDILSRIDAPTPEPWPTQLLLGTTRVWPQSVKSIWKF